MMHARGLVVRAILAGCLMSLLQLVACSDSGTPIITDDSIAFRPLSSTLHLVVDEDQVFTVEVSDPAAFDISFVLDGEVVNTSQEYQFTATTAGVFTLEAEVQAPGVDMQAKVWEIHVTDDYSDYPPTITNLLIEHGSLAGSVSLTWSKPADSSITYPLSRYLVAVSTAGAIGGGNWESATVIDTVEFTESLQYSRDYSEADDGLVVGQTTWFTVRGVDVDGRLSVACENVSLRISIPYLLEGYVTDEVGTGLQNVNVSYDEECGPCRTQTDDQGYFSLGPFPDHQKYILTTFSRDAHSRPDTIDAYYDVRTDSLGYDESLAPLNLYLIPRYGIAANCVSNLYGDHFLTYLRYMTYTYQFMNERPNFELLKWESYPLHVYIEDELNLEGNIYLSAPTREAFDLWNTEMEESYFFETNSEEAADIIVRYDNELVNLGVAQIIDPSGGSINQVIPRKMVVKVSPEFSDYGRLVETMMHEFGHCLMLGNHSECGTAVHLMNTSPYGMLASPYGPIHIDEIRLARCIRYLPQHLSTDMFILE